MTPEEHAARAMWIAEPAEFLSRSIQRSEAGWTEIDGDVKAKYIRLAAAGFAAAIAAEREACAKIAEEEGDCRHVDHAQGFCACQSKADAIRARGTI